MEYCFVFANWPSLKLPPKMKLPVTVMMGPVGLPHGGVSPICESCTGYRLWICPKIRWYPALSSLISGGFAVKVYFALKLVFSNNAPSAAPGTLDEVKLWVSGSRGQKYRADTRFFGEIR